MKNSNIEWCDHTFNPWEGCTKVSPGCANCYAESRNARWHGGKAPNWGKGAPRRRTSEKNWKQPSIWDEEALKLKSKHWNSSCPSDLQRPRVFCASLADWLDDEVPIEWLADLVELIRSTPNLDWLLLTKRPENWKERLDQVLDYIEDFETFHLSHPSGGWDWIMRWIEGKPPENVWIGTTVEDQPRANLRIPQLLNIPAKIRFLSCEPLLGKLHLLEAWRLGPDNLESAYHPKPWRPLHGIDWVICGGESGHHARAMQREWARSARNWSTSAGIPFFFKQWGEWAPCEPGAVGVAEQTEPAMERIGKKEAGRLLDGVEWSQFPEAKS